MKIDYLVEAFFFLFSDFCSFCSQNSYALFGPRLFFSKPLHGPNGNHAKTGKFTFHVVPQLTAHRSVPQRCTATTRPRGRACCSSRTTFVTRCCPRTPARTRRPLTPRCRPLPSGEPPLVPASAQRSSEVGYGRLEGSEYVEVGCKLRK